MWNRNGSSHGGFSQNREDFNAADTINGAWILQGGKQFRTAIMVLAAINLVAAIAMIGNILFDAWTVRKWDFETKMQKYFGWLLRIHPAEMFPLIVSGAVVLQSIVVIPIQGINTSPILFRGCNKTVQLVWPAIWIAPITMLVFGIETTFRSLRRNRFPSRNRWHLPTALAVVVALTIFLWAASNVFPTRGACVTGLIWWTARYFKLAIVVCSGLLFLYITSAIIITIQLIKTVKIDRAERIAATRVVYYLVVNTWIILFVIPYYIQIATNVRAQTTAQFAEIALNLSGIINLLMHIFLRSNADRLAIRGAQTPWSEKRTMRVFGPSDLNIREHISYPVLWQVGDHDNNSFIARSEKGSIKSSEISDIDSFSTRGPLQHAVFPSPKDNRPLTPPLKTAPAPPTRGNNSAYSVFPTLTSSQESHLSTSTTFSSTRDEYEMPLPPPPLFALQHERNNSTQTRQSSATVQIGLRLSYMNHALDSLDDSPPSVMELPLKSSESDQGAGNLKRPDLPRASASSNAINAHVVLPAQGYKKGHRQMPSIDVPRTDAVPRAMDRIPTQAVSTYWEMPKGAPAQSLETLTSQTFQRPQKQAVFPTAPIRPQVTVNTQQEQAPSRPQFNVDSTQIAENAAGLTAPTSADMPKPFKPISGLPRGTKPAPSWRPQNWNLNSSPVTRTRQEESHSRKVSGSDKGLPQVPESAQLNESPLGRTDNPWNVSKPQVIQRPPGWV